MPQQQSWTDAPGVLTCVHTRGCMCAGAGAGQLHRYSKTALQAASCACECKHQKARKCGLHPGAAFTAQMIGVLKVPLTTSAQMARQRHRASWEGQAEAQASAKILADKSKKDGPHRRRHYDEHRLAWKYKLTPSKTAVRNWLAADGVGARRRRVARMGCPSAGHRHACRRRLQSEVCGRCRYATHNCMLLAALLLQG